MDYILNYADYHFFTPHIYPETWSEDDVWRQFLSLMIIVTLGGYVVYLLPATLSFYFIYDHVLMKHPLFLKNQIEKEIRCALSSVPVMGLVSNVIFLLEVRGYSRLYDNVSDTQLASFLLVFILLVPALKRTMNADISVMVSGLGGATACVVLGWLGIIINAIAFIFFTDSLIYWIHRGLHHRLLYKRLHKTHHKWIVPTPFASHAFSPMDGFLQSLPYHLYVFLFPMHKLSYLALFIFVNFWTVSIHDGDYRVPEVFKFMVNGSAHHMDHHVFYNYNYGQFFTLWDRLGGSFRNPSAYEGKGPVFDVKSTLNNNHEMGKKLK